MWCPISNFTFAVTCAHSGQLNAFQLQRARKRSRCTSFYSGLWTKIVDMIFDTVVDACFTYPSSELVLADIELTQGRRI